MEDCHRKVNHGGLRETLAELRSQYWITKGRQFVKKTLHRCVTCKRLEGIPFKSPRHADLPETRVTDHAAFTHVGIDFAGPLSVKTDGAAGEMKKTYIYLYTCAISRALHLELTPDLSTAAFLRCLRRYIARRGTPTSITSDNARTFKGANRDLERLLKDKKVQDFAANKAIKWKFILEKATCWGGYYERMVKLVQRSLRKVLGNAKLTYEDLLTVVTEVEGALNSRPITYVYTDATEEPLNPSYLIIGRRVATLPDSCQLTDEHDCSTIFQRRARHLNQLLEHFWRRWSKEYLVNLREFHRLRTGTGSSRMRDYHEAVGGKE